MAPAGLASFLFLDGKDSHSKDIYVAPVSSNQFFFSCHSCAAYRPTPVKSYKYYRTVQLVRRLAATMPDFDFVLREILALSLFR